MKCAIMQPTYLPWLGYFKLIAKSEIFVFLDDVQFSKRSWQQRNRINYNGKEKILTVPCKTKGKREQLILDVEIDGIEWRKSHMELICTSYGKHPYYEDLSFLEEIYNDRGTNLSDLNIKIIIEICRMLGLKCEFIRSSEIPIKGKKSKYLLSICQYLNASEYLSAAGSQKYIEEEGIFKNDESIKVTYFSAEPHHYKDYKGEESIPYLSVIDYIANLGINKMKEELLK